MTPAQNATTTATELQTSRKTADLFNKPQANRHRVIFVHAYKPHKDWKRFLVKRIMAIEERRHDEVMKMLQALQF